MNMRYHKRKKERLMTEWMNERMNEKGKLDNENGKKEKEKWKNRGGVETHKNSWEIIIIKKTELVFWHSE